MRTCQANLEKSSRGERNEPGRERILASLPRNKLRICFLTITTDFDDTQK